MSSIVRNIGSLGSVIVPLGFALVVACGEAPAPDGLEEGVGRVESADSVSNCASRCQSQGSGTNGRNQCCQNCYIGIPYGYPYVCSTETTGILKCEGDPTQGINLVCGNNTGCAPGYVQTSDAIPGGY